MKRFLFFLVISLLLSPLSQKVQGQFVPSYEDTLEVYADLFDIEEPLHLTIEGDMKEFKKSRSKEKYHRAKMTCHVTDSFHVSHPVRIRARGIYRRDHCTMPPFWLNIRYAGIEDEKLQNVVKMKVVTRCSPSSQYRDYVLKEYLVYKIYNLITEYSFNSRLVRIEYIDTGKKNRVSEVWGFIIEPEDMMADRLETVAVKSDVLSIRTVNREAMDRMALYSYMIGHGDYSITGRHNLKILTPKVLGPTGFIPVPYDFDYTGLVNAHYAVPGESLDIQSVTQRYYLGACRPKVLHQQTIDDLATYQDEIVDLIMGFEYLDEDVRLDMVAYIASYFVESSKDRFIERSLESTCR